MCFIGFCQSIAICYDIEILKCLQFTFELLEEGKFQVIFMLQEYKNESYLWRTDQ